MKKLCYEFINIFLQIIKHTFNLRKVFFNCIGIYFVCFTTFLSLRSHLFLFFYLIQQLLPLSLYSEHNFIVLSVNQFYFCNQDDKMVDN